ncbi:MAG: bacillithiol biosynthesis deacetylase BshB1 [Gracilimonas sp.]|uniref:bacillithiol biosynthesis deacetylase BshB1 n=1 Tax=Gracilimonas TaxID=649462 RepID=UPI001B0AE9F8|nr:bacillithiol biosynthesis deacetylase BshB1 [Gracilimonas sp.]MBO6586587.1 bacillithiol biosynthesis deacetylase BshB1 [Gracilimonas sp.]MBO6615244.1 bacillithiol biosynthesis deacetylase BshB1 [Gracilimonas sp.]
MKLDVLVFASHPDDAELGCGGTIASLTSAGKKVGIIDLTKGEMGTRGTEQTRAEEVKKASEILSISYRKNLDLGDSLLPNTRENQLKIIEQVRATQPHICLVGAPFDRHPDHPKGTHLVLDALFYAGLKKLATPDDNGNEQSTWRPSHILHYMQDRPMEPDFIYDISEHWETKRQAMLAYTTQFNVSDPGDEPSTYISSENYFKQLEGRARYLGHLAGFTFGEAFKYYLSPAPLKNFNSFFDTAPKR